LFRRMLPPVPESISATSVLDLITYLKAISDAHMRGGVRIPPLVTSSLLPRGGRGSPRTAICDWVIAQIPGGVSDLDQLVCDGNTLRGSMESTAGGGSAFIAQVTIYSAALGVAISQTCYATGENHERAVLRQLLRELYLEGLLILADSLHTQKPFFDNSRSRGPTSI